MSKTLAVLFLFFICSCNSVNEKHDKNNDLKANEKFFDIDIRNSLSRPEAINISNLATDIQYIPLETNPSCFISGIQDLQIYRDYIFVLDKTVLYKFDKKGNFIQQIGKIGGGPGEYSMAMYFTIVEEFDEIIVYCYPMGRINVYDAETGAFKRNNNRIDSQGLIAFPPGKISFFLPNGLENANQLIRHEINITYNDGANFAMVPDSRRPHTGNMSDQTIYYRNDSSLFYMGSFQDTLTVLSENIEKRPYISFGLGNSVNGNDIKLELLIGEIQFPDFLSISNILENRENLYIEVQKGLGFGFEEVIYKFLYSKKSGQLICCSELINDIDGGMAIWPKYIFDDTLLVDIQNPFQIINYFESDKVKTDKPENLINLIKNLDENDNPVLVFVKLR